MDGSAAQRLAALRKRLEKARGDNLLAVEEEGRRPILASVKRTDNHLEVQQTTPFKRKRTRTSLRAGKEKNCEDDDEEEDDPILKSINARAAQIVPDTDLLREPELNSGPTVYGGTSGSVTAEQSDRLVTDLKETERRRERFRRRRAFVEDKADISFINEGNRNFNRILEKHYDGFESVRKIKDSLERGTALPE